MWGVYSRKTDVYSFGVLLFESVSREMNIPCGSKDGAGNLVNHVSPLDLILVSILLSIPSVCFHNSGLEVMGRRQ